MAVDFQLFKVSLTLPYTNESLASSPSIAGLVDGEGTEARSEETWSIAIAPDDSATDVLHRIMQVSNDYVIRRGDL